MTTKTTYGAKEAGCWFDGARGIYIGDAIIETAIEHGFPCPEEPTKAPSWQGGTTWTDSEYYHELTDEATEFLQQFAAEGFWFGCSEGGDYGLWPTEEEGGS